MNQHATPAPGVLVREAGAADLRAVVELERQVFGLDAWSAASVADELAATDRRWRLAEGEDARGARVLGYAVVRVVDDVADLQRIAVRPDARRRGMASALLASAAEAARAAGARRLLLEVSADNGAALAFYARHGFTEVDRRPRYYRDGSDAVVMRADLAGLGCGGRG